MTHHTTAELTRNHVEFEVEIEYNILPGCPETGPTYACGGTPEEPAEVDIISVTFCGVDFETTSEEDDRLVEIIWLHHEWPDEDDYREREYG